VPPAAAGSIPEAGSPPAARPEAPDADASVGWRYRSRIVKIWLGLRVQAERHYIS
jgi:hypothetical protein